MSKRAPGKHYREGLSLIELTAMFSDDAKAEKWFVGNRWPDGVCCPRCNSRNVQERANRKPQPFRCRQCHKDFSVKTDTLMHSSPLTLRVWGIALYLLTTGLKGTASMKLHRDVKVTQKTAWHLAHRIRETWSDPPPLFKGPVECDESYFGGKRKNMPKAKRSEMEGRGIVDKIAVVGAKDRDSNQVNAHVVEETDAETLHGFVSKTAATGAQVYTDEHRSYEGLPFPHEAVKHSVGEYVRGQAHTQGIESFWSLLKRGYHGTYHKISPKHLDRYVGEFVGRHNQREAGTLDQMSAMVRGLEHKRLRYADLIDH